MKKAFGMFLLLACLNAGAQTKIDLSSQARNVDFSTATATKPIKVGTSLPPICSPGELFFRKGSAATEVIYACTATNTWSLQRGANMPPALGTGLLAQTADGLTVRSVVPGAGLLITNADGQAGNPAIGVDVASESEAVAGTTNSKLMTPERTKRFFQGWNPIPSQTGKAKGLLTTDGTQPSWTWQLIVPASGTQTITTPAGTILGDRLFVKINPSLTLTLSSTPVIADGEDGQFLTITNVSTTNSITLPDEVITPGSNLRLGGTNLTLAPRESTTFVFAAGPGDWIMTQRPGQNGPAQSPQFANLTDVSLNSPVHGECPIYDGVSGKWKNGPCGSGTVAEAQIQANAFLYCADTASNDTYTCSLTPALSTYTTGMVVWFKPNTANIGSATININGRGAKTIVMESGAPLVDSTLTTIEGAYLLKYDGTNFRVAGSSRSLPSPTNYAYARLTNHDEVSYINSFKDILPSSGQQILDAPTDVIDPDRRHVEIDPDANHVLTSIPTIADGTADGELLYITNIDTVFSVTLQDEARLPGSNLRLGGSNAAIGPQGTLALIWSSTLASWVCAVPVNGTKIASTTSVLVGDGTGGASAIGPQNAHMVYAGPVSGAAAAPAFRALVASDLPPTVDRAFLTWSNTSAAVPAGVTWYYVLNGSTAASTTERSAIVPHPGTLSRLYIQTTTSQSLSNSMTCSLRVNGSTPAETLTITIPGGSNPGPFSDLSRTVAVNAGDRIGVECVNSATGSSGSISTISAMFTF